jgi:aminoglycoside phosphotransferase (APT) family kinase protein
VAETVPLARFGHLIPPGARLALADRTWNAAVMPGGRQVNLCLALEDAPGDTTVLRIRRGPALPGADFARELACHRRAADAGLAPSIRAADAEEGWILMDHLAGVPWTQATLRDAAALSRLCDRLRRLHEIEPPDFAPASDLALLRANCDVLAAHGEPDAATLMQRGAELTAQLDLMPRRPPALCHGDPDVANFLGAAPMLIDFEYAQVADPTYDLALLLSYYPSLVEQRGRLEAAMGLDDALSRRRLPLQLELCQIVGGAWARSQRLLS